MSVWAISRLRMTSTAPARTSSATETIGPGSAASEGAKLGGQAVREQISASGASSRRALSRSAATSASGWWT